MIGIYSIVNKINGKIYIGQTIDINNRFFQHKNNLNKNKHINRHLQQAWNKYGEKNFQFKILESFSSNKKLNNKERFYIKLYKSNNPLYGYNLTTGGEGYALNSEIKNKISISKRGQNSSLSINEVRHIKMLLYCLMDRKEICDIFNITPKALTQIAIGKSFKYVAEELNQDIHNLKQKLIDERNKYILELFDKENSISNICSITGYSVSVVEKCVYKFRNCVNDKRKKYQQIYNDILKLHKKGINNYQISKILKVSPSTVKRYLEGESNPYKELSYKKMTNNLKKEIITLYFNKGLTSYDLAKKYNVSSNTIMSVINNYKYANTEVI